MDALLEKSQISLIEQHGLLVKRIAHYLIGRLPHTVQLDDLIQAGMLGLLEASKHYDPSKGASFETYAGIRIKGHMLDEVRSNDWVPRSVHRNSRMVSEAVKQVEHRLGREAKDFEVAEELGLSIEDYHDMLQDSSSSHLYGFDDLGVTDDVLYSEGMNSTHNEPHAHAFQDDLMNYIAQVIKSLPPKEQLVIALYYQRDLNLKEVGEVLEISESRVSQILTQATQRVKSRLS